MQAYHYICANLGSQLHTLCTGPFDVIIRTCHIHSYTTILIQFLFAVICDLQVDISFIISNTIDRIICTTIASSMSRIQYYNEITVRCTLKQCAIVHLQFRNRFCNIRSTDRLTTGYICYSDSCFVSTLICRSFIYNPCIRLRISSYIYTEHTACACCFQINILFLLVNRIFDSFQLIYACACLILKVQIEQER